MISFIVPAHNEQAVLAQTLAAIHASARSQPEPYEIIVADDFDLTTYFPFIPRTLIFRNETWP
jgi:cellulose synthase/poly-beta-1,6-N-acetylglucosamine synthase-like glycosyltransferase